MRIDEPSAGIQPCALKKGRIRDPIRHEVISPNESSAEVVAT